MTRGHLQLQTETGGLTPWCGPAALAIATGHDYAEACGLLRAVAPTSYPRTGEVITAYWRDLLAALRRAGVAHEPVRMPADAATLLRLVRSQALPAGWYLVRVTDHFLLLRQPLSGLARLHDNHHTDAEVTGRLLGRRKVTHLVRLLGGPLAAVLPAAHGRDVAPPSSRAPGPAPRAGRTVSPAAGRVCRGPAGSPGRSPRR
ncbi:MAG: hypothetical protein K2X74_07895 [Acetobacteraceae bacterium]|nr:hypothetical protein [Acetobacteraceae bacterium]